MEKPETEVNNTDDNFYDDALCMEFGNQPDLAYDYDDQTENQSEIQPDLSDEKNILPIIPTVETNWDLDDVENNDADSVAVPELVTCTSENTNHIEQNGQNVDPEQNDENVDPLAVESDHNEDAPVLVSEECTTTEESLRGILRFTVKINNVAAFVSRPRDAFSDPFYCRGFPFRLLINNKKRWLSLAAFLRRDETENELHNKGLEIFASCELSVYDHIDESFKPKQPFMNSFCAGSDWGFRDFLDRQDVADTGVIHENSLTIQVKMAAEPPRCSTHSKQITGFVGIRNQGATCYMNSLLQVLYFLTKFRTACYRIPTEMDTGSSMALALQKVFYNLEFSNSPICTKDLTKSFGWSTVDVLMQHDVQEMMRVLIDRIETRMKNTLLEPILPSIFQGKFVSYVKCRDVEFSSQREEIFYDIQLSMDNSNNVYESFRRYVSPEMMDDDNKYHAGSHGLQAAEKGTLFISLPPVMFLHLLRFQFDGTLNQVTKNNNFFEFYERINLTEFVREDDTTAWNYTLFAVLSHSGGGTHGHYVAFINPSLKGKWYKFDDDKISIVSAHDAINSNFGCKNDVDDWTKSMQLNAYMLVYVRDSMAEDIFEPTDPKYICEELKSASLGDPDEQNYCKSYATTEVYVLLNTILESDVTFQLKEKVDLPKFSVSRTITPCEFKKKLISAFHLSGTDQIRIWRMCHTQSGLPHYVLPLILGEDNNFINNIECRDIHRNSGPSTHVIWVEIALPGEVLPPFDPDKDVLVFYNYYCAKECRQMYIDHGYHDKNSSLAELIPIFNRLMEWTDRKMNIYQAFRDIKAMELDMTKTFSDYIRSSNTMQMQIVFEPKEHDVSTKLNSIHLYYQDLLCRVEFRAGNVDSIAKDDEQFEMSLESTFPELLDVLARRLNYDKMKMQIFRRNYHTALEPVPSTSVETLRSLFECDFNQRVLLYYKLHIVNVIDVETKRNFTFHWISNNLRKHRKFTLYLSDDETVESILAAAQKYIDSDLAHGSGKFRILKVHENQMSLVDDVSEIYSYIDQFKERSPLQKFPFIRIEEIPKGDEMLLENERLLPVFPSRDYIQSRPAIYPFMFKIDVNETWQCVKDRVRAHLNIPEKNWTDDYSPSVILSSNEWGTLDFDDAKCFSDIIAEQPNEMITICLNHVSKGTIKQRRPSHKIDMAKSIY